MYKLAKKTESFVLMENEYLGDIYKLDLIMSHKEFGNIYIFNNILNMPSLRLEGYNLISQFDKLGIDSKEVEKVSDTIIDLLEKEPTGFEKKIYNEVSNMKARVKGFWDYKRTSMALVGLLCIPEDELSLIGTFNQDLSESNINKWVQDSAMFDFFLSSVHLKTNNLINTLDLDIVNYSAEAKAMKSQPTTIKKLQIFKRIFNRFKTS